MKAHGRMAALVHVVMLTSCGGPATPATTTPRSATEPAPASTRSTPSAEPPLAGTPPAPFPHPPELATAAPALQEAYERVSRLATPLVDVPDDAIGAWQHETAEEVTSIRELVDPLMSHADADTRNGANTVSIMLGVVVQEVWETQAPNGPLRDMGSELATALVPGAVRACPDAGRAWATPCAAWEARRSGGVDDDALRSIELSRRPRALHAALRYGFAWFPSDDYGSPEDARRAAAQALRLLRDGYGWGAVVGLDESVSVRWVEKTEDEGDGSALFPALFASTDRFPTEPLADEGGWWVFERIAFFALTDGDRFSGPLPSVAD